MAIKFSVQSHSALFGVDCDLTTHSEMLQAAECFFEIRKTVEKKRTSLASLTVRQFKNHQDSFRKKVTEAVAEHQNNQYCQLLMPLILDDRTLCGLKNFILACVTLSPSHNDKLAKRNLTNVFPQLFRGIVDSITILPDTLEAITDVIRSVCTKISNPLSNKLQDILNLVWDTAASSDPLFERPAKRSRVSKPEEDPLTFDPELLKAAENEALNLDESPELGSRRIIIQFVGAVADQLEGVFGNSPLFQGLKMSRQWRWERAQDILSLQVENKNQTNCIVALIPDSDENDFSFVIRVGNRAGWAIVKYLQYAESSDPSV